MCIRIRSNATVLCTFVLNRECTYLSSVEYHILAVRKDADGPRRKFVCLAIEGDGFVRLSVNIGEECRTY
jgi:hypothetical protein